MARVLHNCKVSFKVGYGGCTAMHCNMRNDITTGLFLSALFQWAEYYELLQ